MGERNLHLVGASSTDTTNAPPPGVFSKVPAVTAFFWIIKVLCTTVGETASDFLNVNLGLGLTGTVVAAGIALGVVLVLQFRAKKYISGIYWLTVVLISVFGTLATDVLTDALGFPLEASTIIFSAALAITFAVWYAKERTLSIHSIYTRRREAFYWLAILFTFALGTASGDLMAESLGLGYLATGLIVLGVILAALSAWCLGLDPVLAFWIAYILTRPLGASLGDYLSQPRSNGGLGLGAAITSVVFLAAILAIVIYLAITDRDVIAHPLEPILRRKKRSHVIWQVVAAVTLLLIAAGAGYRMRRSQLREQAALSVSPSAPLGDLTVFKGIADEMLRLVRAGDKTGVQSQADELESAWDMAQGRLRPINPDKWTSVDNAVDDVLLSVRSRKQDAAATVASLERLINVMATLGGQKAPPWTAPTPKAIPSTRPLGDLSSFAAIASDVLRLVRAGNLARARSRATDLETAWDESQWRLQPMNRDRWTLMDDAIDGVLKLLRSPRKNAAAIGASVEQLLSVINALDRGSARD